MFEFILEVFKLRKCIQYAAKFFEFLERRGQEKINACYFSIQFFYL